MRARNLKPGLFKNEKLGSADPLLTILFEGLWCMADREGRLEDRPLRVCAEVFPYRRSVTEKKADALLDWLQTEGFIARYEVGGNRFIQVLNFLRHNNPHKHERPSEIPALSSIPHPTSTLQALCGAEKCTDVARLNPESGILNPESSLREREIARGSGLGSNPPEGIGRQPPPPKDAGDRLTQQSADASCEMWREVDGIAAADFERFMGFVTNHATKRKPYSEAARYQLAKDLVGWARGNAETQRLIVDQSIRADHVVLYPLRDGPRAIGRKSITDTIAELRAAAGDTP